MDFPFCLHSFLFSHFLSLLSLAHFLCLYVCLPHSETQPRGTRDWWLTLAVVLFMEAENYTVTFPAFLLEISNRSGLSIQDRDPGGGETGCCYNHFLPHPFLHVDSCKTVSPQRRKTQYLTCHHRKTHHFYQYFFSF